MTALTPMKAIRVKCLDCSGGSYMEVRNCSVRDCSLHRYRFGRRPVKDTTEKQTKESHQE